MKPDGSAKKAPKNPRKSTKNVKNAETVVKLTGTATDSAMETGIYALARLNIYWKFI